MSKLLSILTVFVILPFITQVMCDIPAIPQIWDPNYPLNRCIDFCAFLRPGQICPGERTDVKCLCTVYNIRLPACEQCWQAKNATVANDLTAVLNFCASYGNGTSSSVSVIATATGTETGAAVSSSGASTTTATTVKVTTGSTTATAATFTSDGTPKLYTKVSLMTAMAAAMIVSVYML